MSESNRVKIFYWGNPRERSIVRRIAEKMGEDYTQLVREGAEIHLEYLRPVSTKAGEEGFIDRQQTKEALAALKQYARFLATAEPGERRRLISAVSDALGVPFSEQLETELNDLRKRNKIA